jgi:hypothetical protein
MLRHPMFVGGACCALTLVVDTPARASCGDYGEYAVLSLETVTVDGVVQPTTAASAELRGTVHWFGDEEVRGAALVRTTRATEEFYEPISP